MTTNYITKLAKGDIALSISLTAVMSVIIMITIPLTLTFVTRYFLGSHSAPFNILELGLKLAGMTTIPVIAGMLISRFWWAEHSAEKFRFAVEKIAFGFFVVILFIGVYSMWEQFVEYLPALALASILLMTIMLFIGYKSPFWFGLGEAQARTVAIEAPYQNPIVGFTVAGMILPNEVGVLSILAAPTIVYGTLMMPIVLGTVYCIYKFKK